MRIVTVDSPAQLERFIRMPFGIYKDDVRWVPPLVSAE